MAAPPAGAAPPSGRNTLGERKGKSYYHGQGEIISVMQGQGESEAGGGAADVGGKPKTMLIMCTKVFRGSNMNLFLYKLYVP